MKYVCRVIVVNNDLQYCVDVITVVYVVKYSAVIVVNNMMFILLITVMIRVFCMAFQEVFVFVLIACLLLK